MAIETQYTSAINNVNSNLANFIPSVWAKKILDQLKMETKLVDNCWQEYEGEVKHAGAVHILGIGNVTVGNYEGTVTYNKLEDAGQTLVIDQAKYFALEFDDVERAQTMPGLWEGTREEAVHQLAVERDKFVGEKIAQGTNVTEITAINADAIQAGIDKALVELKKRNFAEEAVIELTPEVAMAFLTRLVDISTNNPEYIKKGILGYYHGHKVIESNGLKGASEGTHYYCAIRGKKAIAFAGQITKVEALRREGAFADAVRGLDVYGAKVIDNDRLQVLKVTKGTNA